MRRPRFDPWVGKIPWRREWQPTLVFLPGECVCIPIWVKDWLLSVTSKFCRLLTSTLQIIFFLPGGEGTVVCLDSWVWLEIECTFPHDLFSGKSVTTSEHESNDHAVTLPLPTFQHHSAWHKGNRPFKRDEGPVISGTKNVLETLGKSWMWSAEPYLPKTICTTATVPALLFQLQPSCSLAGIGCRIWYRGEPVIGLLDMSLEGPWLCLFFTDYSGPCDTVYQLPGCF